MNILVQKYGGTSVESKDKLEKICDNIIEYKKDGYDMVIVVSAQGKYTDNLIKKAHDYVNSPNKKDLDFLLVTGEMQTVALLSMMLNDKGYDTIPLTGEQAGIISDSTYGNAKIKFIHKENLLNHLNDNKIVIVTGFQAVDKFGNLTTLGRGGSDLSAVAIASVLDACKCEIYTDVDGIYSADPRIIPNAKLVDAVSYDEMLEAASLGAKVMHNRAVNIGKKYKMPIIVKNSQKYSRGSIIEDYSDECKYMNCIENNKIKFITKKENLTKISIVGDMVASNQDIFTHIYTLANKLDVKIEMITFSELAINITIDSKKAETFMRQLHRLIFEEKEDII